MASYATGSPEVDAACRVDTAIAAGAGNHLPIGYWSGAQYRSAMRFAKPPWATWTAITKATLTFYISDHQHVGVRSSSIYIRRTATASPWTKAAGTQNCESGFSGGNTTQADDIAGVATGQVSFSSGSTANALKTVDVTAIVQAYFNSDQKPVFVFDPVSSADYTELWADEASGHNAGLSIEYETSAPPTAPTLVYPGFEADIPEVRPRFSWTHHDPQGDAQTTADVEVSGAFAGSPLTLHPAVGTDQFADMPSDLPRGTQINWRVRTYDATGAGAWSSPTSPFAVLPLPVVTVAATRVMAFDAVNHQPRLVVSWTSDQPQTSYRVTTASGYDSGVLSGAATSHTLTRNLTNGTAEVVTVVVNPGSLQGSASRSFTPRWGLTTHRKDLVTVPTGWLPATIVQTPVPDANVVMEYGSDSAANAVPSSGWLSSPGALPRQRYLYWRAWFIPSATASPVLDRVDIPVSASVQVVDKWGTTRDVATLVAPWSVDVAEAVYGTRSLRVDVTGAGPFKAYAFKVKLRAGRTYILTGLMKSKGDSKPHFQLENAAGSVLKGGGMLVPLGTDVISPTLAADTDWYDLSKRDTNRYKTPTYPAAGDMDAYVVLVAGGTAGSVAWFDAIKLEESTVATPWSPAAIGAVVIDAGGVQIDGSKGGVLRYKGTNGGPRDVVEGGTLGLKFGGDGGELFSPETSVIAASGVLASGTTPASRASVGAGNIELAAAFPYIDFKQDPARDFDIRIIQTLINALEISAPILAHTGLQRFGGTAFPAGPATGDRYYRTDLRQEFFWDGARWLSTAVYEMTWSVGNIAATDPGTQRNPTPALRGGSNIWAETFHVPGFQVTGGTALSATHKWDLNIGVLAAGGGLTNLPVYTISSGAVTAWRNGGDVVVNALMPANPVMWSLYATKTGTPGNLYAYVSMTYRIVAV